MIDRTTKILEGISIRIVLGKDLVKILGTEIDKLYKIDEKTLIEQFQEWTKNNDLAEKFGFKSEKQSSLARLIAGKLTEPATKSRFIALVNQHKLNGCFESVASLLADADASIRSQATQSLSQLGAKNHAKNILKLLQDSGANVKITALQALGRLQAKDYSKQVSEFLKDVNINIKAITIRVLIKLEAKEHIKEIANLINEPNLCYFYSYSEKKWKSAKISELALQTLKDWGIDPEKIKNQN